MEAIDASIERFLLVEPGSGDGYGYGSGSGYGDGDGYGDCSGDGYGYGSGSVSGAGYGSGYGYGYGYGSGYGSGSGEGDGDGYGYGYGIESFNGNRVYIIDGVPTLIFAVKGRAARGAILNKDLTLCPCWIVRYGDCFAHGETIRKAAADASAKRMENEPIETRLERFVSLHPDPDKPYGDLFDWHHILTGSCRAGREAWCKDHGYSPTDSITVREFIEKTRHNYGGDIIDRLAELYNIK